MSRELDRSPETFWRSVPASSSLNASPCLRNSVACEPQLSFPMIKLRRSSFSNFPTFWRTSSVSRRKQRRRSCVCTSSGLQERAPAATCIPDDVLGRCAWFCWREIQAGTSQLPFGRFVALSAIRMLPPVFRIPGFPSSRGSRSIPTDTYIAPGGTRRSHGPVRKQTHIVDWCGCHQPLPL